MKEYDLTWCGAQSFPDSKTTMPNITQKISERKFDKKVCLKRRFGKKCVWKENLAKSMSEKKIWQKVCLKRKIGKKYVWKEKLAKSVSEKKIGPVWRGIAVVWGIVDKVYIWWMQLNRYRRKDSLGRNLKKIRWNLPLS